MITASPIPAATLSEIDAMRNYAEQHRGTVSVTLSRDSEYPDSPLYLERAYFSFAASKNQWRFRNIAKPSERKVNFVGSGDDIQDNNISAVLGKKRIRLPRSASGDSRNSFVDHGKSMKPHAGRGRNAKSLAPSSSKKGAK